jgi:amino acid transporter
MAPNSALPRSFWDRIWHGLLGRPRDPHDPSLGHSLSLVAFLAWVGLGVDGLSSSAYGPDEAFRALGDHTYLAVFLAMATAMTVLVISYSYSKVIEHFPHGGGGYNVATQLLGRSTGVVSGSALLVDYVLTITVSIASGGDAIFSLLPHSVHQYKLPLELAAVIFLVFMNLRGLKESIKAVLPFFLLFIVTHVILIFGGILSHALEIPSLVTETATNIQVGASSVGKWGLFLIFLRAYSFGGGTYTGIEAVSNGVGTLREPRVENGKRTMIYLASSLAITAGGLLVCYMLYHVRPVEGQTLNAVLAQKFAGHWTIAGFRVGIWFVMLTLFSESILLLVAAQTGFIDGPRVMANMAVDSWLPRRFAALSDRLTMQNGILLMGIASGGLLLFTRGQIGLLVVMYSINVFITFSITQAAMIKFWYTSRDEKGWVKNLIIHGTGFLLCFAILWVMILEKFMQGAWGTLLLTAACILVCVSIRRHYRTIGTRIKHIEGRVRKVTNVRDDASHKPVPAFDPAKPTAAILVGGYSRLGRRSLLAVLRFFPQTFSNIVFLSVGVVNSEFFKKGEVDPIEKRTEETLKGYCALANRLGLPAQYAYRVGTDVVREASELCIEIGEKHPHAIFFAGELVFERPKWYDKFLHNETAYAIQRQIRFKGLPIVILPLVLHEEAEMAHEEDTQEKPS